MMIAVIDGRRYVKSFVTLSMQFGIVSSEDVWGCRRSACLSKIAYMPQSSEISKTCVSTQNEPSHETWDLLTSSLSKCRIVRIVSRLLQLVRQV